MQEKDKCFGSLVLYLSFERYYDVNIMELCSFSIYYSCVFAKRNYRVLVRVCVCVCVCVHPYVCVSFCTITQKVIDLQLYTYILYGLGFPAIDYMTYLQSPDTQGQNIRPNSLSHIMI